MGIKEAFITAPRDFVKGLQIIFGKPDTTKDGDRKLAKVALMAMGQISIYGKAAVRGSFISNTEKDMKRLVKKGEAHAREKFDMALATPEYMLLMQRLDLDEQHLRVMLMHAMKKVTGKYRMPELSHG